MGSRLMNEYFATNSNLAKMHSRFEYAEDGQSSNVVKCEYELCQIANICESYDQKSNVFVFGRMHYRR